MSKVKIEADLEETKRVISRLFEDETTREDNEEKIVSLDDV